jgi:hypothetical protein
MMEKVITWHDEIEAFSDIAIRWPIDKSTQSFLMPYVAGSMDRLKDLKLVMLSGEAPVKNIKQLLAPVCDSYEKWYNAHSEEIGQSGVSAYDTMLKRVRKTMEIIGGPNKKTELEQVIVRSFETGKEPTGADDFGGSISLYNKYREYVTGKIGPKGIKRALQNILENPEYKDRPHIYSRARSELTKLSA